MLVLIVSGFMIVLTMLLMMARMGLLKWLGYTNIVDVAFTIIMILLFHGTFSGIVAASFAGVFMSALLWVLRSSLGCERYELVKTGKYTATMKWVRYPASACRTPLFSRRVLV